MFLFFFEDVIKGDFQFLISDQSCLFCEFSPEDRNSVELLKTNFNFMAKREDKSGKAKD